jgi:hypothetical protein
MAVDVAHETHDSEPLQDDAPARQRPTPPPVMQHESVSDTAGADLLVYGTDEILKGTDTATLVAFAALAYQQIKGKGEAHQDMGCVLLLISVLACAVVHLSIGNAYVGRARVILRKQEATRRQQLVRMASYFVAWVAAASQFVTLLGGLVLILMEKPPTVMLKYIRSLMPF